MATTLTGRRIVTGLAIAALAAALLAGCADNRGTTPGDPSASGPPASGPGTGSPTSTGASTPAGSPGSPGLSNTQPPTLRPPGQPPKTPSDTTSGGDWVVGTVTTGGTGPCYGLATDEGVQYALHSDAGTRLDRGTRVRIRVAPLKLRIDCGPGRPVSLLMVVPIR